MLDNMYSIKEASKLLDCSTQNIYRQKNELLAKGYWEYSEAGGYYITEKGINFLREKRIETLKAKDQEFNQVAKENLQSVANSVLPDNTEIISVLKQQIQDLKAEKEFWQKKYETKDQELSKANEHLQDMNSIVFQKLLAGTTEKEQQQNADVHKGFFKNLFRK